MADHCFWTLKAVVALIVVGAHVVIVVAWNDADVTRIQDWRFRTASRMAKRTVESIALEAPYDYDEMWFDQPLDHFNYEVSMHFKQRVLVSKKHWGGPQSPIFFYTGNEGDIEWFAANTGFMWEIAPEFEAMIVFAEHRYFGKTMPFGNVSLSRGHLGFLSVSQALADFATLIPMLKESLGASNDAPVIAFGGSYGGMLSAWLRLKYPNAVDGAIASSAPILQFSGITPPERFNDIVTSDFKIQGCDDNIRSAFSMIRKEFKSQDGLELLSSAFRLCTPLESASSESLLENWLTNAFVSMAMTDCMLVVHFRHMNSSLFHLLTDPYPSNFLEPMPAWPINASCSAMFSCLQDTDDALSCMLAAVNVYYNGTGSVSCHDIQGQATSDLGALGWDYLACTSMVMPISQSAESMFPTQDWSEEAFAQSCQQDWGVRPRFHDAEYIFGGESISAGSNIVFSNGNLDPWSGGGVRQSIGNSIIAITVEAGAHHLDLRSSNKDDPPSVHAVRLVEKTNILRWISEKKHGKNWFHHYDQIAIN